MQDPSAASGAGDAAGPDRVGTGGAAGGAGSIDTPVAEFRLLGTVELLAAGKPVDAGPPRQRCVLAALAVDAGRVVPADVLISRVWDQDPPARVRPTLYAYLSRIRTLLAASCPQVRIVQRSGGYVLDINPDQVDVHTFRRLVASASSPGCADSDQAELLEQALGLWRGTPLSDLPGDWAGRVSVTWQRARIDAVVAWAQARLRLGQPEPVLAPLTDLVGEHVAAGQPAPEPLVDVLMLALQAAGRQADALDLYAQIAQQLREQLGADPGSRLQQTHLAILRGDCGQSALAAGSAKPTAPGGGVVPAQLPPDLQGFAGRAEQLAQLDELLAGSASQPSAAVVAAVSGTAGVGKTVLAIHWAHRVAHQFPDGQLYVNLRGFDPAGQAMTTAEAVRGFLDALEVPLQRMPQTLAAQAGLYRSLIAGRRMLVVLDNARDGEQVRQLLPGTPTAMAVVTSRSQLTSLTVTGARPLILDRLPAAEAHELLVRRLGAGRVSAEPQAAAQIISACARLPLALAVAAARADHSGFPLAAVAAQLTARSRLDALDAGEAHTQVRAVFSWSVTALSPAAARLFRLLGLHPGPEHSAAAAASVGGQPLPDIRQQLTELVNANLVAEHAPGRYACHDLLHSYGAELARSTDSEPDRRLAVSRMLDYYLHTAATAALALNPSREPVQLATPESGAVPGQPACQEEALAWFGSEHRALAAAVAAAAESGFTVHTWQLPWAMSPFLQLRGHWQEWAWLQRLAVAAATSLGDIAAQALSSRLLAMACTELADYDEAARVFASSLRLYQQLCDHDGEARVYKNLSLVAERQGRYAEALGHSEKGLRLCRAIGDTASEAVLLNNIGWSHCHLGHHEQARAFCRQALQICADMGDRWLEGDVWDSLGYAEHHLGSFSDAAACYERALGIFREAGNRIGEAETLSNLGDTRQAAGQFPQARQAWEQALVILDDLQHTTASKVRAKLSVS